MIRCRILSWFRRKHCRAADNGDNDDDDDDANQYDVIPTLPEHLDSATRFALCFITVVVVHIIMITAFAEEQLCLIFVFFKKAAKGWT